MVKMNKLKPVHNHFEPPIASMKEAKIASGSLSGKGRLMYNPRFLKGNKQCSNNSDDSNEPAIS